MDKEQMRGIDPRTGTVPKVRWDDSAMTTLYANVCNAGSTREEVTLLLGTHQTWHGGQEEIDVRLSHRVILNPFAAKRLALLLTDVMNQYETRFGPLKLDSPEGTRDH